MSARNRLRFFSPLTLCLGVHLFADWMLAERPWHVDGTTLLIAIAIPLSQCSLAVIWGAVSTASLYLRFLLPFAASIGCWYVLTQVSGWGIGDPASAGWALLLLVQALGIVVGIHVYRVAGESARFTFDLATLMLWITLSAAVFGFAQFGRVHWRWSADIASWEYIGTMPITGAFNSVIALTCLRLSIMSSRHRQIAGSVVVLVLIAIASQIVLLLNDWLSGKTTLSRPEILAMTLSQFVIIGVTLAAFRFGSAGEFITGNERAHESTTQ